MKSKRWQINPPLPSAEVARFQYLHPVVANILYNRGYTDPTTAQTFLTGDLPPSDPFKMKGMAQAVGRIRTAIKKRELIIIYGDFDADGVTSTALLVTTLVALGANVKPYIPHRVDEGYGLNVEALQKIASGGGKLVITVDCGIRSVEEVEIGKQCGLELIVTDHHSVGPEIPRALAVINPKQDGCPYPEKMLAGGGIAFPPSEGVLTGNADQKLPVITTKTRDILCMVSHCTAGDDTSLRG